MPAKLQISQGIRAGTFLQWFREWVQIRYSEPVEETPNGFRTVRFKVKVIGVPIAELEAKSYFGDVGMFTKFETVDLQLSVLKRPGEPLGASSLVAEDFAQVFLYALGLEAGTRGWGTTGPDWSQYLVPVDEEREYSQEELRGLLKERGFYMPRENKRLLTLDVLQWDQAWTSENYLPEMIEQLTTPLPPLNVPIAQNQPALSVSAPAALKRPQVRKRNFDRLWKAYLADEKIRDSPTEFNQASLYKWAGHNEASGLSKAIRDLRKMREEQPEEFQKLLEYGANHPVQEVKDDSD